MLGAQGSRVASREPSRLQCGLVERIVDLVREQDLKAGAKLSEASLASALNVSRTPVRGALQYLVELEIVQSVPMRGFRLAKSADQIAAVSVPTSPSTEDRLTVAIARDRLSTALPDQVTEADLMRRYSATRQAVVRVLLAFGEIGIVERRPGHGWRFLPMQDDAQTRTESYRFRQLIEPAALLEPSFRLDPAWAADMRHRHEATLRDPWRAGSSVTFFELNAGFHEGLARQSGNRFLHLAVAHQNRLRRFRNYNWTYGHERVQVSSNEHLAILERLQCGDTEFASILMRRHIEAAGQL